MNNATAHQDDAEFDALFVPAFSSLAVGYPVQLTPEAMPGIRAAVRQLYEPGSDPQVARERICELIESQARNAHDDTYPDDVRYRAVRHYKDARENTFDAEFDVSVDSYLDHLKHHDREAFDRLLQPV